MPTNHCWEFWIDVGGTFTDCVGRDPDGRLLRHKLLSSGVTKGAVHAGSNRRQIIDPARNADPAGFWAGYALSIHDDQGQPVDTAKVIDFDATTGTLTLATELAAEPPTGAGYELATHEEAPLLAMRYLTSCRLTDPLPPSAVRLGTTRGTNALLTRRGAATALLTTRGFGDVLRIGYQNRPRLFDLAIRRADPLYREVVEIDERVTYGGDTLVTPDEARVKAQLRALRDRGIQALAVCLLHSFRKPHHEQVIAKWAYETGFTDISISSEVAPLIKIVPRGDTTVVDAYLNPVLRQYVDGLHKKLAGSPLRLLTSAGGLVAAEAFRGKDSILSGPAGGVVGFSRAAQNCGFDRAIGFDMGGTSTDVSRFDGEFPLEYENEKAGVRIVAPMMAIHTVAAGGGSICAFDGVKLIVGPDSAGADPGPASYGRGGPLAVTDLNLLLGKLPQQQFPFPLHHEAAAARARELVDEISAATGTHYSVTELCNGLLKIANANMAAAIRTISVAQGVNPQDYVLVAFGGAAGQHACAVARELGTRQILIHPDAGILSAVGIGQAEVVRHSAAGVYAPYTPQQLDRLEEIFNRLASDARAQVLAEGIAEPRIRERRALDLRYEGVDAPLSIKQPADGDYAAAYHEEHRRRYGYAQADRPLEIVAARVEVAGQGDAKAERSVAAPASIPAHVARTTTYFDAHPHDVNVYERRLLVPGDRIEGPAIICDANSTTVVDPHWIAEVFTGGEVLLTDHGGALAESSGVSLEADPIMLEVFNNRFAAIAEQMGATLRNTACSVNVKQRLDFSCAIFTAAGDLVANAPHVPVHLGAMGATVRCVLQDNPDLRAGDVFVTNDPYRGGSHLPDITVVSPVHDPADGQLLFFTASRAHHAEIGGSVPGSMPAFSTNLAEEGVVIRNFNLFAGGQPRFDELRVRLLSGRYPTRAVEDNLADVGAQVAANRQGDRDLRALIEQYSLSVVQAYMKHIQAAAAQKMRTALAKLPDGLHEFVDYLDVGLQSVPIRVAINIQGEHATIDFTGTAPVLDGNLNANRAIVTAAVLYCLRCLIDEDIPLNEGVLQPVEIVLPECLLNPPRHDSPEQCAAVSAGNVETSQRIVDVLLGALGVAAASQGTMNNLLFGNETFGYYETICGGAGATPDADGADAVHTHMTNTRLTDVEVLEQRYPVRVVEFSVRRGSGGDGRRRGGDGVSRLIEFLTTLQVTLLSQRRGKHPPYGQSGGLPGEPGRNTLIQADGTTSILPGQAQFVAKPSDKLRIETPGGGGFGPPASELSNER